MDEGPVTLRVIREMFKSVLLDQDAHWDLPIQSREPHPCAFTLLRDWQPGIRCSRTVTRSQETDVGVTVGDPGSEIP